MFELNMNNSRFDIAPVDDARAKEPTDQPNKEFVLTSQTLALWLDEIRNQPAWRQHADRDTAYYDGDQIDAETQDIMQERGQAPIVDNMIQPTINAVLGMQAKSRTDTRVAPETNETNTEVAEALSVKMKHYSVLADAQRAKSEAYAEQIKAGLGWIEVARNNDPFGPPVRYQHTHRREIFWDWHDGDSELEKARYLVRKRWSDKDVLAAMFPEKADFIERATADRLDWDSYSDPLSSQAYSGADSLFGSGNFWSVNQLEWLASERQRLCAYEVWYRVYVRGKLIRLPNNRVIEFDEQDSQHQAAFFAGMLQPFEAVYSKMRVAMYIGPERVFDMPSPYRHRRFPYVPLFGFRKDRTREPYGLIRAMISPQDEINARKSKMIWLLNAKRVIATPDAVDDHDEARDEISRPDAYVIRSKKPGELFDVQDNQPMAAQQFEVMKEAKESIQTSVGVHNATLGRDSGATSGLAINSLVEQDSITLAEINDNANAGFRLADELLLSLIIDDLSDSENENVIVEDESDGSRREVILNQKVIDPNTGMPTILNDVTKINVSVVLADTPSTPTFRNQQLNQISDMVKVLPPQLQAPLIPFLIDATDLPKRKEMSAILKKTLGLGDGQADPEKEQLRQQVQQLEMQLQMKNPPEIIQAQVQKMEAEIDAIKSRAAADNVNSMIEALKAAGLLVQAPELMPVADRIAEAAGVEDVGTKRAKVNQARQAQSKAQLMETLRADAAGVPTQGG